MIDLWDSGPTPAHQLTVTDGQVTGVRIEIERSGVQLIGSYTVQKQLAAIALCAAQKSYNGISWMKSGVLDAIAEQGFADYTLQAGDVTITQSVEQRGYLDGTEFLFAQEGADPYLSLIHIFPPGGMWIRPTLSGRTGPSTGRMRRRLPPVWCCGTACTVCPPVWSGWTVRKRRW